MLLAFMTFNWEFMLEVGKMEYFFADKTWGFMGTSWDQCKHMFEFPSTWKLITMD